MSWTARFIVAGLLSGLLGWSTAASAEACTDGVDCYCDRVANPNDPAYDPDAAWCEDFELSSLDQNGGSGWVEYFGSPVNGCWQSGTGGNWQHTVEGTCPSCCQDVVKSQTCGVPGESGCVFDGNQSMGKRFRPGQSNGGGGGASFASGSDFGMVKAVRYSTNFVNSNIPKKGDMFGRAQFSGHFLWGASSGTWVSSASGSPFHFFVFFKDGVTPTWTEVVGHAGLSGTPAFGWFPDSAEWDWFRDHGVGTWHCWRQHIRNIGSSNATIRIWMDDRQVVHLKNVDMRGMDNSVIDRIEWDFYYNGGYPGNTVAYKYEDNMHISLGSEPPTCAAIGFDGIVDHGGGTGGDPGDSDDGDPGDADDGGTLGAPGQPKIVVP